MPRPYLARALADSTTTHGVFLDVLGVGVLITGQSGVGKSELALELSGRGRRSWRPDDGEWGLGHARVAAQDLSWCPSHDGAGPSTRP